MSELHAAVTQAQELAGPTAPLDLRRAVIFARMNESVCRAMGRLTAKAALGCEGSIVERTNEAVRLVDEAIAALVAELPKWIEQEESCRMTAEGGAP